MLSAEQIKETRASLGNRVTHIIPEGFTLNLRRKVGRNGGTIAIAVALGLLGGTLPIIISSCSDLIQGTVPTQDTRNPQVIRIGNVDVQKFGDELFPLNLDK